MCVLRCPDGILTPEERPMESYLAKMEHVFNVQSVIECWPEWIRLEAGWELAHPRGS